MNHKHGHEQDGSNDVKSKTKWVFIAFLAIAAYFLITEHKAHLSGLLYYLPFLLLLACPLLHLFHHGGHSGHGSDGGHRDDGGGVADKQPQGQNK
jgi:hypothetical protein